MSWWFGGTLSEQGELLWSLPDMGRARGTALRGALVWSLRRRGAAWRRRRAGPGAADRAHRHRRPGLARGRGRTEPGRAVVLVDGSRSMGIESNGQSRGDVAMRAVIRWETTWTSFPLALRSSPASWWDDAGTDIGGALEAVADRYLGQQLRGIVLLPTASQRRTAADEIGSIMARCRTSRAADGGPSRRGARWRGPRRDRHSHGWLRLLRTPFALTAVVEGQPGHERRSPSVARDAYGHPARHLGRGRTCGGPLRGHRTRWDASWEVSIPDEVADAIRELAICRRSRRP